MGIRAETRIHTRSSRGTGRWSAFGVLAIVLCIGHERWTFDL